jgi:RimJ/RimL family protein N-acetyltransferase
MENMIMQIDERLSLASWDDRHVEQLPGVANNPKIAANMADRFPSPYSMKDAAHFVQQLKTLGSRTSWAIELDGILVGGIGLSLRTGSALHTAGLAYWLGEEFWRKGIASLAVKNVVAHAFEQLALARIETTVFDWNYASSRVLEKCGFLKEGTLKSSFIKNGKIVSRHIFAAVSEKNFKFFEMN